MPRRAVAFAYGLALLIASGCVVGAGGHVGASVGPPPPPPAGGVTLSAEVSIQFFGIPLDGAQDVVFVLDRSGSMSGVSTGFAGQSAGMSRTGATLAAIGGTIANSAAGSPLPSKMEAAKAELIDVLRMLPDGTRFNIVFFSSSVAAFSTGMVVLEPETRAEAEAFVSGIRAGGSTAAVPALDRAYRIGAERIVLLSDGLPNTGGGARTLLAHARAEMQRGIRFDTVGLGLDQDSELLTTLAAESGGIAVMR